jgi:hypothetical protein
MVNYRKYNPVRPVSIKGSILISIVRFLFFIRKTLRLPQWVHLVATHHEDPLKMTFADKLYMGYKYYYTGLVLPEKNSDTVDYFRNQTLQLNIPENFSVTNSITVGAGGDLIPYDCIRPENCEHLWDEAGDFFFNNDIVFANLETVADMNQRYSAAPEVMLHDMFFNIDEPTFNIFCGNGKYRGYDVLSTANNHTMDLGEAGILATQSFLQQKNIPYCGTASSAEERDHFPIINRNGIKIAFLAYTFSLNKEKLPEGKDWLCNHIFLNEPNPDISIIVQQASIARQRGADIIIASLHMGCAYQAYPSNHTLVNMHQICVETGIDILLGGHPHNPQPFEIFEHNNKQHFIAYSLGDFIAYDIFKWCHLPLLLKLTISKGVLNGKPYSQLTRIQVKPFYMYLSKSNKLSLIDFQKIAENPHAFFKEKELVNEVKELQDFFTKYVITEKQQHVLR